MITQKINSRMLAILAAVALSILMVLTVYGQRQSEPRVQWEYRVVSLKDDAPIINHLNELGAEGWELVGFHMKSRRDKYGQVGLYYFKRVK
jgi:hypothetical protein